MKGREAMVAPRKTLFPLETEDPALPEENENGVIESTPFSIPSLS